MKKALLFLLLTGMLMPLLFAQHTTCSLQGQIKDQKGNSIPFANLALFQNNKLITGSIADIDGKYALCNIPFGRYDIRTTSVGSKDTILKDVLIQENITDTLDIILEEGTIQCVQIVSSRTRRDQTVQSSTWSMQDIKRLPSIDVLANDNVQFSIRGSRSNALIFVDGVKIRGSSGIPKGSVQEVTVILGGTSADRSEIPPLPSAPNVKAANFPAPQKEVQTPVSALPSPLYNPVYNAEEYADFEDNDFMSTIHNPLSTFSIDVDKASYALVRRFVDEGKRPPLGAVRLEEMINYFDYNYPTSDEEHPFTIISDFTDCPWNSESKIVKIALQGKRVEPSDIVPSVFTFLVDVSGSMQSANKLPLVQASLIKLLDKMSNKDKVAIVVYAGAAGVVLEPTSSENKNLIVRKVTEMTAGGSTAGGEGIELAYKLAEKNFQNQGNNRIILCTDGDFNVGISSDSELATLIEKEREKGIFLTVLGYGMGNYKDSKLEMLADKGNGNYAYIDNYTEAEKFLDKEFMGNMYTIAKDVKIQVEFNPAIVKSYRLIGYENRMLHAEDFNNDLKDAGEIGVGHSVTALYEVRADEVFCKKVDSLTFRTSGRNIDYQNVSDIAFIKFRYKKPNGKQSILLTKSIANKAVPYPISNPSTRFALSVAAFGMKLRNAEYVKELPLSSIIAIAESALSYDKDNRQKFIELIRQYALIDQIQK